MDGGGHEDPGADDGTGAGGDVPSGGDRGTGGRRWARWVPLAVASCVFAGGVAVLVAGVGPDMARPALVSDQWTAQPALCAYREVPDEINRAAPGGVLELGAQAAAVLDAARCQGQGAPLRLDSSRPVWVVVSGWDREAVRLVEVRDGGTVELVVEHDVPGAGCATTDELRGDLVLVVQGPAAVDEVRARIAEVELDC